jgi:cyclomaltodextrinase / maltogenic alpha-amylase / neopullulanase
MTQTIQPETALQDAHKKVQIGSYYAHYRDLASPYKVLNIALMEANLEPAVVYQKENLIWVRPLSSWLEMVNHNGKMVPRFQKIDK